MIYELTKWKIAGSEDFTKEFPSFVKSLKKGTFDKPCTISGFNPMMGSEDELSFPVNKIEKSTTLTRDDGECYTTIEAVVRVGQKIGAIIIKKNDHVVLHFVDRAKDYLKISHV